MEGALTSGHAVLGAATFTHLPSRPKDPPCFLGDRHLEPWPLPLLPSHVGSSWAGAAAAPTTLLACPPLPQTHRKNDGSISSHVWRVRFTHGSACSCVLACLQPLAQAPLPKHSGCRVL